MSQPTVSKVKSTIYGHGRGWCFTLNDFMGLQDAPSVRKALTRLEEAGFIRRLSWGIYDYPKKHKTLGLLPPDIPQVAAAIARKDRIKLLPSGAYAANLLGLSNQVPAKIIYLTEGMSKKIRISKQEIVFKKTTPKNIATADSFAGLLIQALKHIGKPHIQHSLLEKLRKRLSDKDITSLKKNMKFAPAWIQQIFTELIGEK